MGKVTVKHYLEKKVKPILIYRDILAYPIYVRITVNRNTTQLKSITGALMSEKAFDIYKETGKLYNFESYLENETNIYLSIDKEPHLIQLCIETIAKSKKGVYDFSDRSVRSSLMLLLTSARKAFINVGWSYDPLIENLFIYNFIFSFNQDKSLINSIKAVEKVLNIDIKKIIPIDIFKMWQTIELIKNVGINEMTFIEFINIDYLKLLIEMKNKPHICDYCLISEQYPLSIKEIKSITNILINRYICLI